MPDRHSDISTDNFHRGKFPAHGEVRYSHIEDDLLIIRATGPFNDELVVDLIAAEGLLFAEMSKTHRLWYALVVIQKSALAGPESLRRFAAFRRHMTACALNPRAAALVMAMEVEGRSIMAPLIGQLYGEAGVEHSVFSDEIDARRWLDQIRSP